MDWHILRRPAPEDTQDQACLSHTRRKTIRAEFAPIRDSFAADLFNILAEEKEKALTAFIQRLNARLSDIEN